MGAIAIPVVLVVIVVVAATMALVRFARDRRAKADALRARASTLRYSVPNGVEPITVVVGLRHSGYEAELDATSATSSDVLISCIGGGRPNRDSVRKALAQITNDYDETQAPRDRSISPWSVRFADEPGDARDSTATDG